MQQSDVREAYLDDDLVMPEQFFAMLGARAPKRPEVKLWIAVLEGAWKLRDRKWFEAMDETIGSLRWILWQVLAVDADDYQKKALRALATALPRRRRAAQRGSRHRVVATSPHPAVASPH